MNLAQLQVTDHVEKWTTFYSADREFIGFSICANLYLVFDAHHGYHPHPPFRVIFNDLRTQVDNYSQELVRLLEERDDLHMEQVTRYDGSIRAANRFCRGVLCCAVSRR